MENNTTDSFFNLKDVSVCSDINLRDRIRILLMRKKLGQNQLADLVGISKATMSSIVNQHWKPSSQIKMKIAEVLECDSLVLFGATGYWEEYSKKIKYPEERKDENSSK